MMPGIDLSFNQLAEWYLTLTKVKKELKSFRHVKSNIETFNNEFGNTMVANLRAEDLGKYQEKRTADGIAKSTVDKDLRIVRRMVKMGCDNSKLADICLKPFSATSRLLKHQSDNARKRVLTIAEYIRLIDAAPEHLRALLTMEYWTGMRRGELLGLTWQEVDLKKGFIRLKAERTKEAKAKSIPLNHAALEVLEAAKKNRKVIALDNSDHVFMYKGRPLTNNVSKSIVTACRNAGIIYGQKVEGGLRMHDLRGSFKKNMLLAGVDKIWRDTIMGHALQGMDKHYLQWDDGDELDGLLMAAMDKFTSYLDAEIEKVRQSQGKKLNFDHILDLGGKNEQAELLRTA
jgi:integrase